jgi:hypothetical protein
MTATVVLLALPILDHLAQVEPILIRVALPRYSVQVQKTLP